MKKIIFFLIGTLSLLVSRAQLNEKDNILARDVVSKNKDAIGLSEESLNNYIVSKTFYNSSSGYNMVYLQQTFKGIPVHNQFLVLAIKNDKLLSKSGVFNPSIEKFVNVSSGVPALTAESAVRSAIIDRGLPAATESATVLKRSLAGDFVEFTNMGVSRENITANLIWAPIENSPNYHLAWQVYIIPKTTSDYWMVRVDAVDSHVISIDNYTNYDQWGHTQVGEQGKVSVQSNETDNNSIYFNGRTGQTDLVTTSTYRVVPFPAEAPSFPGGTAALRTDPWLASGVTPNAVTLKWHTGAAATDYDYTRGNNVFAYQDRVNDNTGTVADAATSTTAFPNLTFNFVPDFTVTPIQTTPVPNQQFNTTNLFYWNNIIHDVFYGYGFTEAAGNFQDDNLGRGGAGNDAVNAEAQDGGGTNNANFATPADGGHPRMQMYLWTGTPQLDGDADNGVIAHEYGHGISNRSNVGGTGCLGNSEQGGEGWSDYFALMLTQNWATATLSTGFNSPRGIGTYVLNQPTTGPGIRPAKYTTDFSINNYTYSNLPAAVVPHGVGFIWCTALWEMTWEIINEVGTINPNIYAATGGGGNTIALRLVMEGLRLQPCNPGFIDSRNAILQADQNLYGGLYHCAIIRAFARRGMGEGAAQGSSNSNSDQTVSFTGGGPVMTFTQNGVAGIPESQNIIYNHTITAQCAAITNYTLRDTLPLNVTFVSATNGGTYSAGNRVVSWPVNIAINGTANYGLTVNINAGSYFAPVVLINEPVTSTTISPFWTTTSAPAGNPWIAHNLRSKSAPNSFFTPDISTASDQIIGTTNNFAIGATAPQLNFWHWYNSEASWDGGVLEISLNGGGTWADIGAANFTQNGYNGTLNTGSANPLTGRLAWTGNSGAFVETKVNMTPYANQATVKLRWRFGSDGSVVATGWNVDDILMETRAVVNMRSSLFNAADLRISLLDTITVISAPVCTPPTITAPTVTQPTCATPTGTIVVNATGSGVLEYALNNGTYQSGATFSSLAAGNYNITVRLQASPTCIGTYSSNPVVLTAATGCCVAPTITAPTVTQPTCAVPTGTIVVNATGSGALEYALNNGTYQSSATFSGLAAGNYNITVRLQASPTCIATYISNPVVLTAATGCCTPPTITAPTVSQPTCATPTGTIAVNATGSGALQYSLNNGPYQNSSIFLLLEPGSYNITVRLQASPTCIGTYSSNPVVLIAATGCCTPPVITAPTVTQPTCATPTGTIVVNATGSGALEYALNNGTYQTSATFSNLTVGNYNITVRLQASPSCIGTYASNPVVINAPSCPGKTIPGRVEAEAWDVKNGPQYAVATGDPQGGVQHVIGIVNGSWMDYNVVVLQNGLYNVTFRVATTQNNPQFQVKLGATVLGTVSIPNTGGWNIWQNITVNNIALTAGARTIRIQSVSNETCNFNWTDWVVAGANTAPTANAGPNQTVVNPPTTQVTLAGSGAANNGGTITSHVWTKFSGPAGGNITDPNNYGTTVTALQVGTYVFRLTVTDNATQTATSDVTIIVNPASGKFIPGRIEAEAWDTKAGPQYSVPTTDPEGGVRHVIGMSNGSWLDYNVNVTQAGAYTVIFRVATTQNSSQFQIKQGATVLATVNIPNSSGWDNWINVPVTGVPLAAGAQTLRIQLSSNESCNFNWMDWLLTGVATSPTANAGPNQAITLPANQVTMAGSGAAGAGGTISTHVWSKFSGGAATITDVNNYNTTITGLVAGTYVFRLTVTQTDAQTATSDVTVTVNPVAGNGKTIPGKVEAEAWDAKNGPQYAVPTGDAGGGQQVVGMTNGSWLDYNVNVLNTGSYTVNFRVATTQNNVQFQVKSGATVLGTINIPNTGGWDTWQTVALNNIALTAGLQTIRIQLSSNESCNFNWTDWSFGAPPITPLTITAAKQPAETDVVINKLAASVFPNPTSSYFNLKVQTKSMDQVTVRILDIAGRQVQQLKGNPGQSMRFGDKIVNGTYFIEVRQGSEKVVLKVMKQ